MPILLFRVDERLIHGQVVIGWGSQLQIERYLVVDDDIADSEWEQDLYRLTVGDGTEVLFLTVEQARQRVSECMSADERTLLLTRDLDSMLRLARNRLLEGRNVNLGGIHPGKGRKRVRSYLYLNDADRGRVRALEEEGMHASGRDLPGSLKVGLADLLEE
jgi:PTS system mannose-specific IIB component/fructoselysine and glucoselysine-specific PTS system IIB component